VFHGITLAVLVRMHAEGGGDHVVELDPDQSGGTVRRPTRSVRSPSVSPTTGREEMTVTIVRKPKLLPAAVLWAGVPWRWTK
jgi:hypothetical protein